MTRLPSGTVTFCFTDIEGSTRLLQRLGEQRYEALLDEHRALLRAAWSQHGGIEVRTEGDGSFVVFESASDALNAALEAQLALELHAWPPEARVHVRMGLHTGTATATADDDYVGLAVHHAARVASAANGGQILLSDDVAALTRPPDFAQFADLGEFRLKDVEGKVRLHTLAHPELRRHHEAPRAPSAVVHNLPVLRSRFIGRHDDVKEVAKLLDTHALVTLTGAGGVGKTRLAVEVASRRAGDFADGVWLVELAAIPDAALVPSSVARALGVPEAPGEDITDTLRWHLRDRRTLLVLDNCEHVVDAIATLVDDLVTSVSGLTVLATSREVLALRGEWVWRLASLTMPEADDARDVESYESVELLCDRARAAQSSFDLTPASAALVARICRRLDGIPLALELAASRLRTLTLEEIDQRLDDRFALLTSGYRTDLPRHQTLHATVQWSYDLLDDDERRAFRAMSAFRGGASLAAIESVCRTVVAVLGSLVDRSLVVPSDDRFGMLETIHAYASEQLDASDDAHDVREAHRRYYLSLVRDVGDAVEQLSVEHANLRAALSFRSDDTMLELAWRLGAYWFSRGHWREGETWLVRALEANPGPSDGRAEALQRLGNLRIPMGAVNEARADLQEAYDYWTAAGNAPAAATVRYNLGEAALTAADFTGAAIHLLPALEAAVACDDRLLAAKCRYALGHLAAVEGRYDDAIDHASSAGEVFRADGHTVFLATSLLTLGKIESLQRNFSSARVHLTEARNAFAEMQDVLGEAYALLDLGGVELGEGHADAARDCYSTALDVGERVGDAQLLPLSLFGLGQAALLAGDVDDANALFEQSIARGREMGSALADSYALMGLGHVALTEGRRAEALERASEALASFASHGEMQGGVQAINLIGSIHCIHGDAGRGVRLMAAADAMTEGRIGSAAFEGGVIERALETARSRLDTGVVDKLWKEGSALGPDEAIELALGRGGGFPE